MSSDSDVLVVRLMGGLGNQMFQYACAYALAKRRGLPLVVDCSLLGPPYGLGAFGIDARLASARQVELFNGSVGGGVWRRALGWVRRLSGRFPLIIQQGNDFDPSVFEPVRTRACIIGRWQSEKYFADAVADVRQMYVPRSDLIDAQSHKIACQADSRTMAIHVRRGDLLSDPRYALEIGALATSYYHDALAEARRRRGDISRVFVFSDDPAWCRSELRLPCDVHVVERDRDSSSAIRDLWTLSQFSTIAVSNSTFGWWAAWLCGRDDPMAIVPARTTRSGAMDSPDFWPSRWIKIDSEFVPLA
jgi:hypothetical protein